jgi:hypothetical protein
MTLKRCATQVQERLEEMAVALLVAVRSLGFARGAPRLGKIAEGRKVHPTVVFLVETGDPLPQVSFAWRSPFDTPDSISSLARVFRIGRFCECANCRGRARPRNCRGRARSPSIQMAARSECEARSGTACWSGARTAWAVAMVASRVSAFGRPAFATPASRFSARLPVGQDKLVVGSQLRWRRRSFGLSEDHVRQGCPPENLRLAEVGERNALL